MLGIKRILKFLQFGGFFVLLASCAHSSTAMLASSSICISRVRPPEKMDSTEASIFYSGKGASKSRFMIVGVRQHSRQPEDHQFLTIEALLELQKPTFIFYEGYRSIIYADLEDAVRRAGEPGFVRSLAAREGIRYQTWEPPKDRLDSHLIEEFGVDKVQLYSVLRFVSSYAVAHKTDDKSRAAVDLYLGQNEEGGVFHSYDEVLSSYSRYLPNYSPLHVEEAWFDPRLSSEETGSIFVNDIARSSTTFRNQYLVWSVARELSLGEKVLVLAGEGHVPPNEKAFECLASIFE